MNKVSVIVATYRRKESLVNALLSLVKQSYPNVEIILVDDNAQEYWNQEVESIKDKIISEFTVDLMYVKNKENVGSAESRNIGIRQASGNFITFLDDDDVYLPDKIARQVDHMILEGSDFSITDIWLYDEQDNLIEKRIRYYIDCVSRECLLVYHLLYHMSGTDAMMFKKDYLFEIGLFDAMDVGDEYYLMIKAIEGNGKFSYLSGCDIMAYVHTETEGLSSGIGKIKGENDLFEFKRKYFGLLTDKQIRYVTMRHYAVIAFAQFRAKHIKSFLKYAIFSFVSSPLQCMHLFFNLKRR
jgi:glycosyltransferase involved in cell wall biosynthesis